MRGSASLEPTLEDSIAEVLSLASRSSSPGAIAATAAALTVRGEAAKAIHILESRVELMPKEALLWSDLAAAHLEAGDPLRGLVAADTAMRLDPSAEEARINRSFLLEFLGLPPTDATPQTDLDRWRRVENDVLRAAASGDATVTSRLATAAPDMLRRSAEAIYLRNWADTRMSADEAEADRWLRTLRTIGGVLRERGDAMIADTVAAIDDAAAQGDSGRLDVIARAQIRYDSGRRAYAIRDYAAAEHDLRASSESFHAARCPMERVAQTWNASVLIEMSRMDDAHRILTAVLASERPLRHRAVIGQAAYLLSISETLRGNWTAAIEAARESAKNFREIGESAQAATSDNLLADILDILGQPEAGWDYRLRAFRATTAAGFLNRVLVSVASGTRAAMRSRDRELALSLLDVELSLASRVRDPLLTADMFLRRAIVQAERGASHDSAVALARARIATSSVTDLRERDRLLAELDMSEAIVAMEGDPRRAITLLDRTLTFSEEADRRLFLPEILWRRGRAHAAVGELREASRDFSAAFAELEAQRGAIDDRADRARMLDAAELLFDDALALHVRQENAEAAFLTTERGRARSLLDTLQGGPQPVASSADVAKRLPSGTLLIEYAVLPERLVIFTLRENGLRMNVVNITAAALASHANLSTALLAPIRHQIAAATTLVFVPDKLLQRVPFATLRWHGNYLMQSHLISVAPSASHLVAAKPSPNLHQRSLLVVGNAAPDPELLLAALPAVKREVAAIAAIHRSATVLFGAEATKRRFIGEAPNHDLLHFGGHAASSENSIAAALLFARDGEQSGAMDVSEIAALRLPRAPVVTLAACGTLRGRIRGVDGMTSVARAFLAAGASAVVGTLQAVEDAHAARLLTDFHRHLAVGKSPAAALRDAQLDSLARGGDAAAPKNWGQFVVYTAIP